VRRIAPVLAVVGVATLVVPVLALPASAHEQRTVGRYHVEVGFGDEPAYAGERNSVVLLLADAHDKPVTDLGDTLKVEVSNGDHPATTLDLQPNFEVGGDGTPGDYRAWFIPTALGKDTFHFVGTIKGQKVDQRFTSSPTTFDEVQDPTTAQYPVKDPTTGQLAQRLDREVPRLDSALAASQAAERKAHADAGTARTLAIAGIAVGLLGLVVAGVALARRPAAAGAEPGSRVSAGKA
jgi:hypothetical protein